MVRDGASAPPHHEDFERVLVAAPQEAKHYTARHWPGSARYDDFVVKQVTFQRGFGSRSFG
jgi:hypothetical protein